MKVEQKKKQFAPIVITVESIEELRELVMTLNCGSDCYDLWHQLEELLDKCEA